VSDDKELRCPRCGKRFELTPEYLAEYAGLAADCECGETLMIPDVRMEESPPVVSYAAPQYPAAPVLGVWQDKPYVVVARGARMPERCCICNAPIGPIRPRTLQWTPHGQQYRSRNPFLFLVQSAIADSYSQAIVVRIGRCREHRQKFTVLKVGLTLIGLGVFGIGGIIVGAPSPTTGGRLMVVFLVLALVGTILTRFRPRIRIEDFHDNCAWLSGFGDAYLDALPELEAAYQLGLRANSGAVQRVAEGSAQPSADAAADAASDTESGRC
jgi:hypothetical protein